MKVNFGIYIPVYGGWLRGVEESEREPSYSYAAETALLAEEVGIRSIWVPDHMLNPIKGERSGSLEAWTTLTALAAVTSRVELFHTTLCQGFRYPAVLAKMGATIDDVSQGRFRFALGAGWFRREFEAYGVPWHDHDSRIDRAREQIEIVKSLWTRPQTNYEGKFYQIVDGILEPKPIQKPHPPIWWGGESEKSRKLVASIADGWLMSSSTLQEAREKVEDMTKRLQDRGRGMKYAVPGRLFMEKTDMEAERKVRELISDNHTLLEDVLARDFVGSSQTIADKIQKLTDLGFDHIIFQISPALKTLNAIAEDLMPLF